MIYTQYDFPVKITGITKVDELGRPITVKVKSTDPNLADREHIFPLNTLKSDKDGELDEAIKALQISQAKEFFNIGGWEHFFAWQKVGPRVLEMAISDRIAAARHAKVLIDAKFEMEEVPADDAV